MNTILIAILLIGVAALAVIGYLHSRAAKLEAHRDQERAERAKAQDDYWQMVGKMYTQRQAAMMAKTAARRVTQ